MILSWTPKVHAAAGRNRCSKKVCKQNTLLASLYGSRGISLCSFGVALVFLPSLPEAARNKVIQKPRQVVHVAASQKLLRPGTAGRYPASSF